MEEALEKKYRDRVMFKDESKNFDIATNPDEMINKIRFYIKNEQSIQKKKYQLITKCLKSG